MRCDSILDAVGGTPLVRLNRVTKDIAAEVYVKADYLNPGGSMKDRIAVWMIDEAERKGLLKPGMTATAEIVVRERRLIDLGLDPFRQVAG